MTHGSDGAPHTGQVTDLAASYIIYIPRPILVRRGRTKNAEGRGEVCEWSSGVVLGGCRGVSKWWACVAWLAGALAINSD